MGPGPDSRQRTIAVSRDRRLNYPRFNPNQARSHLFGVYAARVARRSLTCRMMSAITTWLWLSAVALLFGAEINAEAERSRELREARASG